MIGTDRQFIIFMRFPEEGRLQTRTTADRFSHRERAHVAAELVELSNQMLNEWPETKAIFEERKGKYKNSAHTIIVDEEDD